MSLHFPFAQPPGVAQIQAVAAGVYWLRMDLPFQLDHINLWLIADGDGWCAVDSGFANEGTQQAWHSVLAATAQPLRKLLVTHFHPDHLGLAAWLQEKTAAPLYMTTGEFLTAHAVWNEVGGHGINFMVEQFRLHGLDSERLEKYAARRSGYRSAIPALPMYYRRLRDADELDIGGRRWRVMTGAGHSPEHAAFHCPELGVFISGDMLLPRISTNIAVMAATPDADALGDYLASLARYAEALPPETLVLPSHGLPFIGVKSRVDALLEHHRERLQVLEKACVSAQSAASVLPILFQRPLDMHQTMFAMGEAIAHLNHLEQRGRLTKRREPDGVFRFLQAQPAPSGGRCGESK